ncbi:MAG: aminopeptidase N [Actinomycetota bacterium]|nr:aminopeptidase N [Actinomycetota bacterium]
MVSLTVADARERARTIHVDRYAVDLDLTRGDEHFASTTTIRFRCDRPGSSTFLDVHPHTLHRVRLNGEDVDVTALRDGRLPLAGLRRDNEVEVAAEMSYSHDGEGLHRTVDPADGRAYLYAMSFLDAAPRIFACFDQPDLKAPYSLTVTAPRDWTVVGNGAARPVSPGRWQLAETQPLSTYFVTLVAGPYHSVRADHDGIPLGLHVKQSLAEHLDRDAQEILRVTGQAFDEYHRLFGVRYPFGEYHQAFVPEFNAGAMENPGCVTFRDQMVFRSRVTDAERGSRARTIVHEMAHQWFGDLVTMTWWDDLWLNESFAEFMTHRVCQDATDFTDAWVDFAFTRKRWGMIADQRPTTHPVAGNGATDAAAALSDFDGISYAKGAALLKQLNTHLGDDVFLSGVRRHIRKHAFGNAALADLLAAWEDAGAADIHGWAEQWLRLPGVDTFSVSAGEGDRGRPVLRRTPPAEHPARRPHTLTVAELTPGGSRQEVTVRVVGDTTPVDLVPRAEEPVLVPDANDDTWAKIRLDPRTVAALPKVLPQVTDPVTRAVLWNSLTYAVDDAELDPQVVLEVLEAALPHERQDVALSALLGWATSALRGRYLRPGPADRRIAALAEAVLSHARPGGGAQIAAARALAASATEPEPLSRWLDGDAPDGLAMDADMRWTVLRRLCVLGAADEPALQRELGRDRSGEGAVHAARCRAALPSAEAKAEAWRLITRDATVANYVLYATCEGFWAPEQATLTRPYVERYFAEIPATAALRSGWVVSETAKLAYPVYAVDETTLGLAEETLRGDLDPGVRRAVADRTHDLRRAVAVRRRFSGRAA